MTKSIKLFIFLFSFVLIVSSCGSIGGSGSALKQFEKKDKYSDNNTVLGLNATNVDYNYYTKSILEYLFIKEIIDGNGAISMGTPKYDPSSSDLVTQMVLFDNMQDKNKVAGDSLLIELEKSGIKNCVYDLPKKLSDLKSGFQFHHYVFKSTNRAAMQAFGILDDSEVEHKSLYVVTDYLQYQDVTCTGLPTIRYAVGMRAQLRIAETESKSELSGIGSYANLAAQVETGKKSATLTIRTIGITGNTSRFSLPNNTSFDVKTYSQYERTLDFIKNLKDLEAEDPTQILIEPQIIPVIDDHMTTMESSFHPVYESIELLETRLVELAGTDDSNTEEIARVKKKINEIKIKLVEEEVTEIKNIRDKLLLSNRVINDYSKYTNLLQTLNGPAIDGLIEKLDVKEE